MDFPCLYDFSANIILFYTIFYRDLPWVKTQCVKEFGMHYVQIEEAMSSGKKNVSCDFYSTSYRSVSFQILHKTFLGNSCAEEQTNNRGRGGPKKNFFKRFLANIFYLVP